MKVPLSAKESAITALFRHHGAVAAGACVPLNDLASAWTKTGLRASDLVEGLTEMVAAGVLTLDSSTEESRLTVSAIGAAYFSTAEESPIDLTEQAEDRIALDIARHRRRMASYSGGFNRRQSDQMAAAKH